MKAGILTLALAVLVIEGFFVYRWYDRYYGYDAASDAAVGEVTAPEERTGSSADQYSASNGTSTDQRTGESTEPEATQDAGGANSGENADESTGAITFTHTATEENSRDNYTYLDHPRLDGDPGAVVLATVSQDGEDGGSTTAEAYDHTIGVWYESTDRNKWAIFNQDLAAMPAGTTFEVAIPPASESFVHRAEPANIVGNATYLDNPLTNGEPDATLSVTQNWNPGGGEGVYNDHPVDVFYDEDVEQWAIYNSDEAPMPDGSAFNVAVSGSAESAR